MRDAIRRAEALPQEEALILEEDEEHEDFAELPVWAVLWDPLVHVIVHTAYFLLIASVAVAIDLGLHWFERRWWVERYVLSRWIRWDIEFMAYALATVDCFLFLRTLIKPLVEEFQAWRESAE